VPARVNAAASPRPDYAALLDAAHQHLNAEMMLIWDNLNTHISTAMRRLIANRDWLHAIQLL